MNDIPQHSEAYNEIIKQLTSEKNNTLNSIRMISIHTGMSRDEKDEILNLIIDALQEICKEVRLHVK